MVVPHNYYCGGGHRDKKRGQIAGEREWIELDGWLPGGEIAEAKP